MKNDPDLANDDEPKASSYSPSCEVEEKLVLGHRFSPFSQEVIWPTALPDEFDITEVKAGELLESMKARRLLEDSDPLNTSGRFPSYRSTLLGWRAREHVLRERGLRHDALVHQDRFDLQELVLAFLMGPWIRNSKTQSSLLNPNVEWALLRFHLDGYDEVDLEAACRALLDARFAKSTLLGTEISITERGKKKYRDDVAPRLQLSLQRCILDLALDETIQVFFSWQSEHKPARNFIKKLLNRVIDDVNATGRLIRKLKYGEAADEGEGAVRIDVQLLERIKEAHIFVADLTPVAAGNDRRRLNDNVLVEVGYALASKDPGQILLLAMERGEDELEKGSMAFDIANVRRLTVTSDSKKDRDVHREIESMLRKRGWLHDEK